MTTNKTKTNFIAKSNEMADKIISAIENGTAPWVRGWKMNYNANKLDYNPVTGKEYIGQNAVICYFRSLELGTTDPRWYTMKGLRTIKGASVRKGEKGTMLSFYIKNGKKKIEDPDTGEVLEKIMSGRTYFYVWNACQIDGLPPLEDEPKDKEFNPIQIGEDIINESKAIINYGGNQAFYRPALDNIQLPERHQFKDAGEFYSTALHELGHWTGHKSRLDRSLINSYGSPEYAKEELRAEIASWMLSRQTGLPHNPDNHASYIDSWLTVLKKNKNEIYKAINDAQRIVDFLLKPLKKSEA